MGKQRTKTVAEKRSSAPHMRRLSSNAYTIASMIIVGEP